MSDNFEYRNLPPFKWFILENFPFIEADFDALTNWELMCKLGNEINKLIESQNITGEQIENLTNAFNGLKAYVDNYFENLDVQDEINNKLDEMAENGDLASAISNYLNLERNYDTIADLVEDETLIDGQKVKVNGEDSINDGGGGYYLINDSEGITLDNGLKAKVIDNFLENYYDFPIVKERLEDTDCYTVTIPLNDSLGNQINPSVDYHPYDDPQEYARKNYTSLTMNASIAYQSDASEYPIIISNGELKGNNYNGTVPDYCYYLGIKADRSFATYSKDTSYASMIADGTIQAFQCFGKIVDNSTEVSVSYGNALVKNPRIAIGLLSDNSILIFACDGRIGFNEGITCHQLAEILIDKGCVTAWNIDGGGSTSLILNGSKINRDIDGGGTEERPIHCTLNFKKETKFKDIAKAFSKIGFEKQNLIEQMFGDFINVQGTDISNKNLDNMVGYLYFGYGNNLTNSYKNYNGYFINIPHSVEAYKYLYNVQLFSTRDRQNVYMRRMVNGTFTPWELVSGINKKSFITTTDYAISTTGSYEKIKATQANDITDVIYLPSPQPSNDYTTVKINRIGYATFKLSVELEVLGSTTTTRYFRLYKGNSGIATVSLNPVVGRNVVYYETIFNNDNVDNEYTIAYNGVSGDKFRQCSLIFETN